MIQRRNAASANHDWRGIFGSARLAALFEFGWNLVSQLLDPATGQLTGAPLNIGNWHDDSLRLRRIDVSISGTGNLVYGKSGATRWQLNLVRTRRTIR